MLPNLSLLEQICQQIKHIPNRRKESKRRVHYCLFLLCQKAGLRVSEAVNFDLNSKTHKGLYRIKSKGKKERLVYIPRKVVNELEKNNWKPNNTNRFNFYHFLRKIRKKTNLPANTELTPHTLRRAFATYNAENGLPLPLLSKLLGHKSVRTTALYWMNIYNDDGNDTDDILTRKAWLEKPKKPQPEPDNPIKVNLEELPELPAPNLLASEPPPNYLSKINHLEEKLSQVQRENKSLKSENNDLQQDLSELSQQNTILQQQKSQETIKKEKIQQELSEAHQTINQLEKELTAAGDNLNQEQQINSNLRQQLQSEKQNNQSLRKTNANLASKIQVDKQTITNLQKDLQNAIKDKYTAEKQLNYLTEAIKKAAFQFHQWQKINYYQQWEKQNELKTQILQPNPPPPWKFR